MTEFCAQGSAAALKDAPLLLNQLQRHISKQQAVAGGGHEDMAASRALMQRPLAVVSYQYTSGDHCWLGRVCT